MAMHSTWREDSGHPTFESEDFPVHAREIATLVREEDGPWSERMGAPWVHGAAEI